MSKRNPNVLKLVRPLPPVDRKTRAQQGALEFRAAVPPDVDQLIDGLTSPLPDKAIARQMVLDLRQAIRVGFVLAVVRYQRELKANDEAMAIVAARYAGADKGRIAQANRKQDRQARVQALLNQGMDVPEIAKELGCSVATVYRLMQPAKPTPAKPAKRARRG
jgi:DNA invertase Pin-like site-specific DNA recombinase